MIGKHCNKNKIHEKKNAGKKTFLFRDTKIEIIGDDIYNKNKIHEKKKLKIFILEFICCRFFFYLILSS